MREKLFNEPAQQTEDCSPGWSEPNPGFSPAKKREPALAGDRSWRAGLRLLVLLFVLPLLSNSLGSLGWAQEPTPEDTPPVYEINKAELRQALIDLTNTWTVMCVAAHPDDEDGTTLTVLRRKHGAHTVTLFSTFGEGGQNAIGPELYEELGVIRARETLKASEIQGSEAHFLGLKDFGFSKSSEETFRIWGRAEALRLMVLKIRELRPDVIITNHDTSRGHGHHQATGQLILEAFDAAADPKRFPEQLARLKTWQPQRLFVRVFGATSLGDEAAKIVTVDPNEVDPSRETSFAEQALAALQQHATQGPWPKTISDLLKARGGADGKLPLIRYRLVRTAPNAPPITPSAAADADTLAPPGFVAGISSATMAEALLARLIDQPNQVLQNLIGLRIRNENAETATSGEVVTDPRTEERLEKALALAAGISLKITARDKVLVPGRKTTFDVTLTNAGEKPIQITGLTFSGWAKNLKIDVPDHLLNDTDTVATIDATTPGNAKTTVPESAHLYGGNLFGVPFSATAEIDIEGAKFRVATEVRLNVAPAVEIKNIQPSPCVRTEESLGRCAMLKATLSNHLTTPFRGNIKIKVTSDNAERVFNVERQLVLGAFETREETLLGDTPIPNRQDVRDLRSSGAAVVSIYQANTNNLITTRSVPLIYAAARVVDDLSVGYVPSFDTTLEGSLAALGVEAKALTASSVQNDELSEFDTIVIDNRAYEAYPQLIATNQRLLDFVNAGGTLIVFYHKTNEWNPDPKRNRPQLAPYPIIVGDERVTEETAPIRFLQPRHPLLNIPNKIGLDDFKDWIQERGLYFPKEWDRQYAALFAMNDTGEKPLRGGLLVGKYGKGNYIYTSMVWYRQLRAGVPGAYRMFANMISYGKSPTPPVRSSRPARKRVTAPVSP